MEFFDILFQDQYYNVLANGAPQILYCLLNRIPVIIFTDFGKETNSSLLKSFGKIMYFRQNYEIRVTPDICGDIYNLKDYEESDPNFKRYMITSLDHTMLDVIKDFEDLKSWVITLPIQNYNNNTISFLQNLISLSNGFVSILIRNNLTEFINFHNINWANIDLNFENQIISKITSGTKEPLEKMRNILSIFAEGHSSITKEAKERILDMTREKVHIMYSIIQAELEKFISISYAIFNILYSLEGISNFAKVEPIESSILATFLKSYGLKASLERVLSFVHMNWSIEIEKVIMFLNFNNNQMVGGDYYRRF